MAYGDLTYFRASRAANHLFPEIGAPIQKCVFDTWTHGSKPLHSEHRCLFRAAKNVKRHGLE